MNKNLLIGGGIVLVLVAGFFALNSYIYHEKQSGIERGEVSGRVVEVNRDAVAYDGPSRIVIETSDGLKTVSVPSMGLPLCAGFENIADPFLIEVGDVVEVTGNVLPEGDIIPCDSLEHYLRVTRVVRDSAAGFTFEFLPARYVLQTLEQGAYSDPSFIKLYTLMLRSEYEAFVAAQPEATEGPASISVAVFNNTNNESASMWVDNNHSLSNIGLVVGEVNRDAVVSGANAVRYTTDGLYRNEVAVVAHAGFIYMISGAYPSTDSPLFTDFNPFLKSLTFIPPSE